AAALDQLVAVEVRPLFRGSPAAIAAEAAEEVLRDADEPVLERIEPELLFEDAFAVLGERILDGVAREAAAAGQPERLEQAVLGRILVLGMVFDQHGLDDEHGAVAGAARVDEGAAYELADENLHVLRDALGKGALVDERL